MISVLILESSMYCCRESYDALLSYFRAKGVKVTKQFRIQGYLEVENMFRISIRAMNSPSSYKGLSADIVICEDEEIRMSRMIANDPDIEMMKINSIYSDGGLLDFIKKSLIKSKEV